MLLAVSGMIWAQSGNKAKPVAKAPVKTTVQPSLRNLSDSASYAIGLSVASFYRQQGVTNLNTTLVSKAINDVLMGKQTLLTEDDANRCVNKLMTDIQESKSKPNME